MCFPLFAHESTADGKGEGWISHGVGSSRGWWLFARLDIVETTGYAVDKDVQSRSQFERSLQGQGSSLWLVPCDTAVRIAQKGER